nr:MAG TPA: hypothetical protein [Caudoviricetes sp.]
MFFRISSMGCEPLGGSARNALASMANPQLSTWMNDLNVKSMVLL